MEGVAPWGALLLLGILLIVIGFEGCAGRIVAVIFTPRELQVFSNGFPVSPGTASGYGGQAGGTFGGGSSGGTTSTVVDPLKFPLGAQA